VEEADEDAAAEGESDDDLRTLENRPRRDGKRAQPSRLSSTPAAGYSAARTSSWAGS